MDQLALVALIGLVGTILGGVATYATTMRRVRADEHIAQMTLASEAQTDDRKALREFLDRELGDCRTREAELQTLLWQAIYKAEEFADEAESNIVHLRTESER